MGSVQLLRGRALQHLLLNVRRSKLRSATVPRCHTSLGAKLRSVELREPLASSINVPDRTNRQVIYVFIAFNPSVLPDGMEHFSLGSERLEAISRPHVPKLECQAHVNTLPDR